jgi:hypothetical protein
MLSPEIDLVSLLRALQCDGIGLEIRSEWFRTMQQKRDGLGDWSIRQPPQGRRSTSLDEAQLSKEGVVNE